MAAPITLRRMSIAVPLEDLPAQLADYPWGYLLTVSDELQSRVRAVPTELVDGKLRCRTGDGARGNVAVRPRLTMVFPSLEPGGFSLIVDGDGEALEDGVTITPTHAVLHRPALR